MLIFFGHAEHSYSQAKFILNVTGGYSQPVGNFRNSIGINDTASADWPYLMRTGYNLDLTGKLTMNKEATIKLVFNLGYNGFKNWGDLNTAVPVEKDGGGATETQTVQFLPDVSIIVLSLGGQYDFNPKTSVNPFVGLDFTANFFGGNFGSNPSSNFPKNNLKSETRFGLQLGGGVDFNCNDYIGVICGMKYNFANLIGKGDYQSDATSTQIVLNDDAGGRNISYLQIYAGVSFYIGNVLK
ncbi:MAG TPA: opacity family porin [Ignavibacteria bacterium]|nr:opacity family porin [Ignavibacteria bacterium]HMR38968.1 opacity family porin [Ignavibacteria bacterium]